jgi:hypothetical protein
MRHGFTPRALDFWHGQDPHVELFSYFVSERDPRLVLQVFAFEGTPMVTLPTQTLADFTPQIALQVREFEIDLAKTFPGEFTEQHWDHNTRSFVKAVDGTDM